MHSSTDCSISCPELPLVLHSLTLSGFNKKPDSRLSVRGQGVFTINIHLYVNMEWEISLGTAVQLPGIQATSGHLLLSKMIFPFLPSPYLSCGSRVIVNFAYLSDFEMLSCYQLIKKGVFSAHRY